MELLQHLQLTEAYGGEAASAKVSWGWSTVELVLEQDRGADYTIWLTPTGAEELAALLTEAARLSMVPRA
jgi:hypothetical protein